MRKTTSGFTIVELLIVIVVIAILAAISIVAYTGIQKQATMSSVQSDLRNIGQQAMLVRVEDDTFSHDSWARIFEASGITDESLLSQDKEFAICWNANNDFTVVAFAPVAEITIHGDVAPYFSSQEGGLGQLVWDSSTEGSTSLAKTCNQTTPENTAATRRWSWQLP